MAKGLLGMLRRFQIIEPIVTRKALRRQLAQRHSMNQRLPLHDYKLEATENGYPEPRRNQ